MTLEEQDYISPFNVNTDDLWIGFCRGLEDGKEKGSTCRLYAYTAKEHGRWELTQAELNAEDRRTTFLFNCLDELGWFSFDEESGRWSPTERYFKTLIAKGKVLEK